MNQIYIIKRRWILFFILIFLAEVKQTALAQVKSKLIPFTYLPDISADQYNQRIRRKTLPDAAGNFVCLGRKSTTEYEVAYYTSDLKKLWQTSIILAPSEDLEAFDRNEQNIWVLTHQKSSDGTSQQLYGHVIALKNGQKSEPQKLFAAPGKSRRIGTAVSPDGSKLMAYQYIYEQDQLKAISATVYDSNLTKIKDQNYSFRDLTGIQSAKVQLDNAGNQYVALVTNNATKISVRRYNNTDTQINGQDIQLGGVFNGEKVYILDAQFIAQPDSTVYAAAICADDKTGAYHSLKVVKFDFAKNDLKFAPEFRFTPQYLAEVNKLLPAGTTPVKKLEDISLAELVISTDKDVLVIAEKKYNESLKQPYIAQEMHLFAYDSFLNPAWHSVIDKNQSAPPAAGFAGISYRSQLWGQELQILTLETRNGKTDLFNRTINLKNGTSGKLQALGLQLNSNDETTYLKDYTAWLNAKTLVSVTKATKKTGTLQLSRLTFK